MNTQQVGIIALIHSALTGQKNILPNEFDFDAAYKCAKNHRIVPLLYYGILNSNVSINEATNNKFFFDTCQAIMVSEKQSFSLSRISKAFENNSLDFMPLKGSIIKDLYPKVEMRTMGDVDVLFKVEQYEKIVPLLEGFGLKFVKENENEFAWDDHPFYLEMHRFLVSPQHKDYFKYFGNGWQFARLAEGSNCRYVMSDEDYYIYLFAHLTKHYRFSGVGIKHLVDIWVYLNAKTKLDMKYIEGELKKLKMYEFHKNIIKTVRNWFDGESGDYVTELITDRVFKSGAFGTVESARDAETVKNIKNSSVKHLKLKRFINFLFPSYKNMCKLFPILEKNPVLLPFLWLWRIVYAILFKKEKIKGQYNDVRNISYENAFVYERQLEAVGLDYDFGE